MKGGLKRRLLTGGNAVVVALAVVATIGLVVGLAGRHRVRWDLTADADSTLLPETVVALRALDATDAHLEITAFTAQKRTEEGWLKDRTMRDFLRELAYASDRVDTRLVDLDRDRFEAEDLGVSAYGTVVVEAAGDRVDLREREVFKHTGAGADRALQFHGEPAVARAIQQLLARERVHVYVLQGHGELRIVDNTAQPGLTALPDVFETQGWEVSNLDLLRDAADGALPEVPADAAAVLVLGPRFPLALEEEVALRAFLARGGGLGFFLEPSGAVPDLVERLGVVRPSGVVFDQVAVYPHQDRPLLQYPGSHLITAPLREARVATILAHAAPLEVAAELPGVRAVPLLQTSRRGWIERGDDQPPSYTEGVDVQGPVVAALAVELARSSPLTPDGPARAVVVGDADLASDELFVDGPGNAAFVTNVVRWLIGEDERMIDAGRPTATRRVTLSAGQLTGIRWVLMALFPLLAILGGAVVWLSRRAR